MSNEKRLKIVDGRFCVDGLVTDINVVKFLDEDNNNETEETVYLMTDTQQLRLFHDFNGETDRLYELHRQLKIETIILLVLFVFGFASLILSSDLYDVVNSCFVMYGIISVMHDKHIPYSFIKERLYKFSYRHCCVMVFEYILFSRTVPYYNLSDFVNFLIYMQLLGRLCKNLYIDYEFRQFTQVLINQLGVAEYVHNDQIENNK